MNRQKKYRLLEPGEPFLPGDECLRDNCKEWEKVPSIFMKCTYNPYAFLPIRREIILRAFCVYPGPTPLEEGCLLVFAKTNGQARAFTSRYGFWEYEFIEYHAHRAPDWDYLTKGDQPFAYETNQDLPKGARPFYSDEELDHE